NQKRIDELALFFKKKKRKIRHVIKHQILQKNNQTCSMKIIHNSLQTYYSPLLPIPLHKNNLSFPQKHFRYLSEKYVLLQNLNWEIHQRYVGFELFFLTKIVSKFFEKTKKDEKIFS